MVAEVTSLVMAGIRDELKQLVSPAAHPASIPAVTLTAPDTSSPPLTSSRKSTFCPKDAQPSTDNVSDVPAGASQETLVTANGIGFQGPYPGSLLDSYFF